MRLALFTLLMLFPAALWAQVGELQANRYVVLGASANAYKGTLSGAYRVYTPGLQVGLQFNKRKRLNGGLYLGYGTLTGQNLNYTYSKPEAPRARPNTYFRTVFVSAHFELHLNLFKQPRYCVYLSQGLGLYRFSPEDTEGKSLLDQINTRAPGEDYSNVTAIWPTSLGFTYFLKNGLGLGLQAGWQNTSTNYLDNIHELSDGASDNASFFRLNLSLPFRSTERETPPKTR